MSELHIIDILVLIGSFVMLLLIGVPISFAMGISSLFYIFYAGIPITIIAQRMSGGLNSFPLLAMPLYILAGELMNTSGAARRIFDFASSIVGHLRGGLGHVNIFASMIFAGISGTAVSDAASLGAIEIKAMNDAGYDPGYSAAITAASSAIGPIIPPSVVLIIYGVMAEVSIGRLFLGGIIPGVLMGITLMVMVYSIAVKKKFPTQERATLPVITRSFGRSVLPLLLPLIILSGIVFGVTTPTEAGVIAVVYSVLLGFIYKELTISKLRASMKTVVIMTCAIMFTISLASIFSRLIIVQNIPQKVAFVINAATENPTVALLIISLFLIILGMFIDTTGIIIIATPIFAPVIAVFGIDPVHFGIVLTLCVMIGIITPPMGICLFIVAELVCLPVEKIIRPVVPFFLALVIALVIIIYQPWIVTWLPNLVFN